MHQSLQCCNQAAHKHCLLYLLGRPDSPSALYPSTDKSRLLFLCGSVFTPLSPCYLCRARTSEPQQRPPFKLGGPVNACQTTSAVQHLPSMAALSSAAQLASKAMVVSLAACLELLPVCCTFITQEFLAISPAASNSFHGHPSTRHPKLTFRGCPAMECDRLVAMLLGGIMDAFNTHFMGLADMPLATQGALCYWMTCGGCVLCHGCIMIEFAAFLQHFFFSDSRCSGSVQRRVSGRLSDSAVAPFALACHCGHMCAVSLFCQCR